MKNKTSLLCAVSAIALVCSAWATDLPSADGFPLVDLSASRGWSTLARDFSPAVTDEQIATTTLVVRVTADATLTFDQSEVSISNLYFYINTGVTLTLAISNPEYEVSATGEIVAGCSLPSGDDGGSLALRFAPSSGTLAMYKPTQLIIEQPCEVRAINVQEDGKMKFNSAANANVRVMGDIVFSGEKKLSIARDSILELDNSQLVIISTNNLDETNFTAVSGINEDPAIGEYRARVSNSTNLVLAYQRYVGIKGDAVFDFGPDFEIATSVVASITNGLAGVEYILTVGGQTYTATSVAAGESETTVTFSNVAIPHSTAFDTVAYEIASEGVIIASGSAGASVVSVTAQKVDERKETTGRPEAGGSWKTAVSYDEGTGVANISNNTFTPTSVLSADKVIISVKDVKFTSVNDADYVPAGEGQGAATIAEFNDGGVVSTNFVVLATNTTGGVEWKKTNMPAEFERSYTIDLEFDYVARTYSVAVDGEYVTVEGLDVFGICSASSVVSAVEMKGSGDITALEGIEVTGSMVKDNTGRFYNTVLDAISSYNKANTYYLLHDTDTSKLPKGWNVFERDGKLLLKQIATGLIFMTF